MEPAVAIAYRRSMVAPGHASRTVDATIPRVKVIPRTEPRVRVGTKRAIREQRNGPDGLPFDGLALRVPRTLDARGDATKTLNVRGMVVRHHAPSSVAP